MSQANKVLGNITPPMFTGELPSERQSSFADLQAAIMNVAEGNLTIAKLYQDARFQKRIFVEIEGRNPDMRAFRFDGANGFCCLVVYEVDQATGKPVVYCNELNDVFMGTRSAPTHMLTCYDKGYAVHPEPNHFAEPKLLSPYVQPGQAVSPADGFFEAALRKLGPTRPLALVRGGTSITVDVR